MASLSAGRVINIVGGNPTLRPLMVPWWELLPKRDGQVDAAIDAAETAFQEYRFSSPQFRSDSSNALPTSVSKLKELAQLLTVEVSKPITFSRAEVTRLTSLTLRTYRKQSPAKNHRP
ncbi:MAG: aldehyde dehydrogenase family protein [Fimbriimonadaceae bacterium]